VKWCDRSLTVTSGETPPPSPTHPSPCSGKVEHEGGEAGDRWCGIDPHLALSFTAAQIDPHLALSLTSAQIDTPVTSHITSSQASIF